MTEATPGTGGGPGPLAYRFSWTPGLYREIVGRRPPAALGLTGSRKALLLAVAASVGLIALVALLPGFVGVYPLDDAIVALWGAVGGLLAVLLVVIPHLRRARVAADLATRIRQGEVRVRLSAEGVEMQSDLTRSLTRWPGVALVSETPRAALIWLGAVIALPVPDAALPADVTRAELLRRIATWRGEGP